MRNGLRSFLRGIGSVLEIFPARRKHNFSYHQARTIQEALERDGKALRGDWERVGRYISNPIRQYGGKLNGNSVH